MTDHFYIEEHGITLVPTDRENYQPWSEDELPAYLRARKRTYTEYLPEEEVDVLDWASSLARFFVAKDASEISNAEDALAEMSGNGIATIEISFIDGSKVSYRPELFPSHFLD